MTQFREHGLLQRRRCQRSDSTHVLAAVRALNRLEWIGSTLDNRTFRASCGKLPEGGSYTGFASGTRRAGEPEFWCS
jgi:hypothetical protein